MDESYASLEQLVSFQGMLGYLNFSQGKPDPRFQKQLDDAYRFLAEQGAPEPWTILHELSLGKLAALQASGASAFTDVTQAEAVLALVFTKVLPAYRRHHADLLFHLSERDLFQPFFLARVFEAVLTQGGPWEETDRIVSGTLGQLNDFVGHRPVAILETRPKGEPYDHERVRPIPLYLRGAGVAWGRYHDLIEQALQILQILGLEDIRTEAYFDLDLLDELALDPRAYDQGHPVNRRPNYVFGEWDPHHIDNQGRYRRFVVRQVTLDALLDRVEASAELGARSAERPTSSALRAPSSELLFDAAAVLAGTMLMAAGSSGGGPATHDSTTTLATLTPRIARYRDAFYATLLQSVGGPRGDRLRQEAAMTRQPFGGARQHLNHYLARHRAAQLQQRHIALLFAEMGYSDASREEAARIPAASARMLSEILSRLTTGQRLAERGEFAAAAQLLPEIEDLLHRGIDCGALPDPWNILGFQGLFPLFNAREDSMRDPRIDQLVQVVERLFNLYARLASEAGAAGDQPLAKTLTADLRRLAAWWDHFATVEVSEVRRVHGGEAAESAQHVATALARWHERGEATADLAFWRTHLEGFHSPKAFALVVDALLRKEDYRAGMALLMNWLGQVEQVPLEEGDYSFHTLALRWMLGVAVGKDSAEENTPPTKAAISPADAWRLVKKFFDYLEANAEDYWQVPSLESVGVESTDKKDEAEDNLYGAAYENVTFRDSADDNQEGSVADGGSPTTQFDLEREGEQLARRLRFFSTLARLWQIAAWQEVESQDEPDQQATQAGWLATARQHQRGLLELLDALHAYPVPEPSGSHDSLLEYDRRRALKEQLQYTLIGTCLDTALVVGTLQATVEQPEPAVVEAGSERPPWDPLAIRLEQALSEGDAIEVQAVLPAFLQLFQQEPLLFTALADGGQPRQILRVRTAQTLLQALVTTLPRLGLLRETYLLLKTARAMEQAHRPPGQGVTEFNELFQAAYQAVVESLVDSAAAWDPAAASDRQLVEALRALTAPFLTLWNEHSRTLRLSVLETLRGEPEWQALQEFIRRYGHDLFHAKFMVLGNVRGVLHRGAGAYLDYLRDNPDPLHPVRLIDDLDTAIPRDTAVRHLHLVLQAVLENYEEYKDYNTTTTQSDYGENLHQLLDFLRLKASYDRHAWQVRPLVLAHEVLAYEGRIGAAILWQEAFTASTAAPAAQHLEQLARLEQTHGIRLRTVTDRLQERFVKPLALDRLCALIEPAMAEAATGDGPSFARLRQELQQYTATPTGVGLDVPHWLRRLETEVERVQASRSTLAVLAQDLLRVPQRLLTFDEFRHQLQEWDKPAAGP